MARPEKVQQVEALRARLANAGGVILTDFRGLNVGQLADLRKRLRKVGVEYKVIKNTLLARAAESLSLGRLAPYLEGPTGVTFCADDPVLAARILQEYIRQMRKLEVKGGLIEGQILSADQIKALAELPPKTAMLAQALGALKAPTYGLVGVLTGVQRNLVFAIEQIRKSKESSIPSAG